MASGAECGARSDLPLETCRARRPLPAGARPGRRERRLIHGAQASPSHGPEPHRVRRAARPPGQGRRFRGPARPSRTPGIRGYGRGRARGARPAGDARGASLRGDRHSGPEAGGAGPQGHRHQGSRGELDDPGHHPAARCRAPGPAPGDRAGFGHRRNPRGHGRAQRSDAPPRGPARGGGGDHGSDHARVAQAGRAAQGPDPRRPARGGGRRGGLPRSHGPLPALPPVPLRPEARPLPGRRPHAGAPAGEGRGAGGLPLAAPARSGRVRRLYREVRRGPAPEPAHPLPHGADQFRQDLRGPAGADRRADGGLPRAAAPPGAGELRVPARARPAGRHGHRRGGAGRVRSHPHGPDDRDRGPDPAD